TGFAASRWCARSTRPSSPTPDASPTTSASFNDRGLDHPDERFADLFAATEDDVFAFYRARQFHAETAVSSAAWRAQLSTIKQAHEFLRATYDVPIPFRVVTFINPAGYASTTAPELRARTRTGSRGNPITPGYAELLVQGALRIDQHGHQNNARTVDRDARRSALLWARASGTERSPTSPPTRSRRWSPRRSRPCGSRTSSPRATPAAKVGSSRTASSSSTPTSTAPGPS